MRAATSLQLYGNEKVFILIFLHKTIKSWHDETCLMHVQLLTPAEVEMYPEILGPQQWPASSTPPSFSITTEGNTRWIVEFATNSSLMHPQAADQRQEHNYWCDDLLRSGNNFAMPQEAWEALGVSGQIFYRIFTTSPDSDSNDLYPSVADHDLANAPFLTVGSSSNTSTPETPETQEDLAALCRYLGISSAEFAEGQRRYFDRLKELLIFHHFANESTDIGPATFRESVRQFQRDNGLTADGIPGEDTLWALNQTWAEARNLSIVRVEMDTWIPAGEKAHVPAQHGYAFMRVRSDISDSVIALREELNSHGVLMTSAGAYRNLAAEVTSGRSTTSIHYSGVAFDLSTVSGMVRGSPQEKASDRLYVITREETGWKVWSRSETGSQQTLNALEWSNGETTTREVTGNFIDVTEICSTHGFQPIGPRANFPKIYSNAEWWHFQNEEILIPWISQFGAEILSLDTISKTALKNNEGIWDNRKKIFKKSRNGWW